jgi:hypothetical protein
LDQIAQKNPLTNEIIAKKILIRKGMNKERFKSASIFRERIKAPNGKMIRTKIPLQIRARIRKDFLFTINLKVFLKKISITILIDNNKVSLIKAREK